MPVPINLNNDNSNLGSNLNIDYSILLNYAPDMPKNDKKIVTANDKDATILMEIWTRAEKKTDDVYKIGSNMKISYQDINRLKSNGLITGTNEEIRFTNKGRTVVTTMVLGENNNFLKNKKQKSYTEIMSSMNKRGLKGYRIPKMASNNLINLKDIKDNTTYETN